MNQGNEIKSKFQEVLWDIWGDREALSEDASHAEIWRRISGGGILLTDRTKDLRQKQVNSQFPWVSSNCFPAMPCFLEKETNHRNQKRKFGVVKGMRWTQVVRNSSGDVYRGPSYMPCPDSPHVEYRRQGAAPFCLWTTLSLPRPIRKSAFQTKSCY